MLLTAREKLDINLSLTYEEWNWNKYQCSRKNNEEKEATCTEEILKNIKAASVISELEKILKYE